MNPKIMRPLWDKAWNTSLETVGLIGLQELAIQIMENGGKPTKKSIAQGRFCVWSRLLGVFDQQQAISAAEDAFDMFELRRAAR